MLRPLIIVFFVLASCFSVSAQSQPTLDNFAISNGVRIHLPPAPPKVEPAPASATRRVRRNGRWVTVPAEPAVQRTALSAAANRPTLRMGTSTSLKGLTTGNSMHDQYIVDASKKYRIDPLLIYAQMHQESAFRVRATSHKGASGLMQLMPATARRFGVTSIYDPKQNIEAGVRYMRWLLDFFDQDVVLALAGYNAGEGAVLRYGRNVPPFRETQEYVRRISARYNTISNPITVQPSREPLVASTASEQKESRPLTVFEPAPLLVRLPDGSMMLVNQ
jgi:soluble lytic murein transglycosylase-like protein